MRAGHMVAAVVVAALCAAAAPVAGAQELVGREILAVRMVEEGKEISERRLLDLLDTRPGSPLSLSQVRESVVRLMALGRFDDVQVHATGVDHGVSLLYDLVPIFAIERITFSGDPGLRASRMRAHLVERFGRAPAPGIAPEMAASLRDLHRQRGYMNASVSARPGMARGTLVFDVVSGRRAHIGEVVFAGGPPEAVAPLRSWRRLRPGRPYDPEALQRDLQAYVQRLRSRLYYEAEATVEPRLSADGETVDIDISLVRGPRVTIYFEGDALSDNERDRLVPIRREASVDEDLLEDSSHQIEEHLRLQGYRQAAAPFRREEDDGALRIIFTVKKGPRYTIGNVTLAGNDSIPHLAPLRLQPGMPFKAPDVRSEVDALTEHYRRNGFGAVRVSAVEEVTGPASVGGAARVDIQLLVVEGVRTTVGSVTFEGNEAIGEAALRSVVTLAPGNPFYEPQLLLATEAVLVQYLDRGFRNAVVIPERLLTGDRSVVDLRFVINEGRQVLMDHVLIVGNTSIRAETIERELLLKPGQPLGLSDLAESQRRLASLGLFRRSRITELQQGSDTQRDVLVAVEEARTTTIGYGGGMEAGRRAVVGAGGQATERWEVAPRGSFEIGRRNLWGKNRSINFSSRVAVRRSDFAAGAPGLPGADGAGFREYRFVGAFREPRLFGSANDAQVAGFVEHSIRTSYNFGRRGARIEVARRLSPRVSLSGRYSFDRTELFDVRFGASSDEEDRFNVDRLFPQVRLSALSSSLIRDTRDDPIDPGRGELFGVDGKIALRSLGSEVGFAKTFLQGFMYRRLPGQTKAVFAAGARLGAATGFARDVTLPGGQGELPVDGDGTVVEVVRTMPASERFFAGGDSTVRGFSLDRLGTAAIIDPSGFSRGGHALVILNAEVRVPVWRDLGAVGFLDAGNVFANVTDIRPGDLRFGAGVGIRYQSPIGPLRVDLGFKVDRAPNESPREWHISLGHAF
jgi:outer membrane protein insertion porin family